MSLQEDALNLAELDRRIIRNHYSELSTLVHGRKTVTQEEARNAFKVTLEIIEALYVLNGNFEFPDLL